jgi:N-acetylneuraminic acid mutarotase
MRSQWIFISLLICLSSRLDSQPHWRLISGIDVSSQGFLDQNTAVTLIWGYELGRWSFKSRSSQPKLNSYPALSRLQTSQSYWLNIPSDQPLALGTTPSITTTLPAGFHLIPGDGGSVAGFLDLHPEVSLIWSFSSTGSGLLTGHPWKVAKQGDNPGFQSYPKFETLDLGKGYWVRSDHRHERLMGPRGGRAKQRHGGAKIGDRLFFYGGDRDFLPLNDLDIFDIASGTWSEGPSGPVSRSEPSVVASSDRIYFMGGRGQNWETLDSLDIYVPGSAQWLEGTKSPRGRYGHSAVLFGEKMYVYGGRSDDPLSPATDAMDVYDLASGTWDTLPGGGGLRSGHSAVVFSEKMWILGGTQNGVVVYDFVEKTWSNPQFLELVIKEGDAIAFADQLVLLGGIDRLGQVVDKVTVLSTAPLGVNSSRELLEPRAQHTSILHSGKVYSWGGRDGTHRYLDSLEITTLNRLDAETLNRSSQVSELGVVGSSGDIMISFDLLDADGDTTLSLRPEFSLDGGQGWRNPSRITGSLNGLSPGPSQTLIWHSSEDFSSDQTDVRFRMISSDGQSPETLPIQTPIFPVDNGIPTLDGLTIDGFSGEIQLEFQLADIDLDPLFLALEFSLDRGGSWKVPASIMGATSGLILTDSIGIFHRLTWDTVPDVLGDAELVLLRLTPSDGKTSQAQTTISTPFAILNRSNTPPTVKALKTIGNGGGILIQFVLQDLEQDLQSVSFEVSQDGGLAFTPLQSISGSTQGLEVETAHVVIWESEAQITGDIENILLRLSVDDGLLGSSVPTLSRPFAVYNANSAPGLDSLSLIFDPGLVRLGFSVDDFENDRVRVRLEFDLDSLGNWVPVPDVHLEGSTSNLSTSGSYRLTWYIEEDLRQATPDLRLRVQAFDDKEESLFLESPSWAYQPPKLWSTLLSGPRHRGRHIAAFAEGLIYFWGGTDGQKILNSMDVFDLANETWSQGVSGGTSRVGATAVENQGRIYIHGGTGSCSVSKLCTSPVSVLEIYDSSLKTWSEAVAGITSRTDHSSVIYQDRIFIFGGRGSTGALNSLEIFDINSLLWSQGKSGPIALWGHRAVIIEDKMLILGGVPEPNSHQNDILHKIWIYDLLQNIWLSPIYGSFPRAYHSAVTLGSQILALGGFQIEDSHLSGFELGSVPLNTQDRFTMMLGLWREDAPSHLKRAFHSASVVEDKVYVFGGFGTGSQALNALEVYHRPLGVETGGNSPPVAKNLKIDGSSEEIEFRLDLEDANGDPLHLLLEVSLDGGQTWSDFLSEEILGLSETLVAGASLILTWDSSLRIHEDLDQVRVRATPRDRKPGLAQVALSDAFEVLNDPSNHPPSVSWIKAVGNRGQIELVFQLIDEDNDSLSVALELSFDQGLSWQNTTEITGPLNSLSEALSHRITWFSSQDYSSDITAHLRILVDDGRIGTGMSILTTQVALQNGNDLPRVDNIQVQGFRYDLSVSYEVENKEAEPVSIDLEYSLDSGQSWIASVFVSGALTAQGPSFSEPLSLIWESLKDIQSDEPNLRIRLRPFDPLGLGIAGESSDFSLANENYRFAITIQDLRFGHSAVLVDKRIIVWGGENGEGQLLDTVDIHDLSTGLWQRGVSGGTPRKNHSGVAHSGKIYYWGGESDSGRLDTLDIYDIQSDSWTVGSAGGLARQGHSGILYEGRIYHWGGKSFSGLTNNLAIYEIGLDQWITGPSGGRARVSHSAVLSQGQIYFWGGRGSTGTLNTQDVFDLQSQSWSTASFGGQARHGHSSVLLGDQIYHWGGSAETGFLNTLDIYHPLTDHWTQGDAGGVARDLHGSIGFDGEIYHFGGRDSQGLVGRFEVYTPPPESSIGSTVTTEVVESWVLESDAPDKRRDHGSVLYQGRLFVFGGEDDSGTVLSSLASYSLTSKVWTDLVSSSEARKSMVAIGVDGRIFFLGGSVASEMATRSVEIYDPQSGSWSQGTPGGEARSSHAGVLYHGRIYLWGGVNQAGELVTDLDVYEPQLDSWVSISGPDEGRKYPSGNQHEGRLYFWGGEDENSVLLNSLRIYDVESGLWIDGESGGTPRKNQGSVLWNGQIYFWGGIDSSGTALSSVDIYDIGSDSWLVGEPGGRARYSHSLTLYQNQAIALGGVDSLGTVVSSVDSFRFEADSGISWLRGVSGGTARSSHQVVSHRGKAFFLGGKTSLGALNSVDTYDFDSQLWSQGSAGGTTRFDHSAVIHQGRTYLWGGENQKGVLNSLDILSLPTPRIEWFESASGGTARRGHAGVVYEDRLWFFGGVDDTGHILSTVELFDSNSGTWSSLITSAILPQGRQGWSANILDQQVLLWGGQDNQGSISSTLLVFDLTSQSFLAEQTVPAQISLRTNHNALRDREILYFIGGRDSNGNLLSTMDLYDPHGMGWSQASSTLSSAREKAAAVVDSSHIYLWGGEGSNGLLNSLEIYDLSSQTWSQGPLGGRARKGHQGGLQGHKIYFFGGEDSGGVVNTVDVYDINTGQWSQGSAGGTSRTDFISLQVRGKFLNWGGANSVSFLLNSLDNYLPDLGLSLTEPGLWSMGQSGGTSREFATVIEDQNLFYIWGGQNDSGLLTDFDVYSPQTGVFSSLGSGGRPRAHPMSWVKGDVIYHWGGEDGSGQTLNSLDLYDLGTGLWSIGPSGGSSRAQAPAIQVGGKVYLFGGRSTTGVLDSMDIYVINPWRQGPSGGEARSDAAGIEHQGKLYFWGGTNGAGTVLDSIDIFDTNNRVWSLGTSGGNARFQHRGTVVDDRAYFWGGLAPDGSTNNMNIVDTYSLSEERFLTGTAGGRARFLHSGSSENNRIYFWGGKDATGTLTNTLDIFDPGAISTSVFTEGSSGGIARFDHTATVYNGKIYFWGGRVSTVDRINSLDIYDPAIDSWSSGPTGGTARSGHTAVLVDGHIYFYGGTTIGGTLDTVDVFDIEAGEWQLAKSSLDLRSSHSSILVSGSVYHWGGVDDSGSFLNSLIIHEVDPWHQGRNGSRARFGHQGVYQDGKIYFWGGKESQAAIEDLTSVDIYDLAGDSWSQGTHPSPGRILHSALLHENQVYSWGGLTTSSSAMVSNNLDILELRTGAWTTGFLGGRARSGHLAFFANGLLHQWGGRLGDGTVSNSLDILTLGSSLGQWSEASSGGTSRVEHTGSIVDGKIYFWGGSQNHSQALNTLDIYSIDSDQWSVGPAGGTARLKHSASVFEDKIYFWGGVDGTGLRLSELDIYDTSQVNWLTGSQGGRSREGHSAGLDLDRIHFWGGEDHSGSMNTVDIYDIPSDSWSQGVSGGQARSGHSLVEHNGVHYLWGGRGSTESLFDTLDTYIPGVSQNRAPAVTQILLAAPPLGSRFRDRVPLSFGLQDADGDSVTVAFEYSVDGGQTWSFIHPGHFDQETRGLSPGSTVQLVWESFSDITQDESELLLRITPTDGEVRGVAVETADVFAVNNAGVWMTPIHGLAPRSHHSMVQVDGGGTVASRLVVWGGFDKNREFMDSLNFYDLSLDSWSHGSPGPLPGAGRAEHSAVVYGDSIYHWGGRDASGYLNSFATYKYDTDDWRFGVGVSGGTPRALHTAVNYQGRMYLWGGEGSDGLLNTLEAYNFTEGTWMYISKGGRARRSHAALRKDGLIYFYGGVGVDRDGDGKGDVLDSMDIYDLSSNSWKTGSPSGVDLEAPVAVLRGDRIFVWGGVSPESGFSDRLLVYLISSDEWIEGQSGGTGRRSHSGVSFDGVLYYFGGFNRDELETLDRFLIPEP